MSQMDVELAVISGKRAEQLAIWRQFALLIQERDLKMEVSVVGHGHRIARLANDLAEECLYQMRLPDTKRGV